MADKVNGESAGIDPVTLAVGGNALLALMDRADLLMIAPWCSRLRLERESVLIEADEPAKAIYFIEDGVASMTASRPAVERTEVALIGPESFVGACLVIGDGRSPYRTFVQSDHLAAIRLPAAQARQAMGHSPSFHRLLLHAVYTQMVQVTEGLLSAAWQRLDARLARWLLMYRDRARSDRLEVTHGFMAMMLGAQRTGVTATLHELEGAGLISAGRGLIIVRDADGLRQLAGGGYGIPEAEHARLFDGAYAAALHRRGEGLAAAE
jgi:CRP-like cAMP-binding protein